MKVEDHKLKTENKSLAVLWSIHYGVSDVQFCTSQYPQFCEFEVTSCRAYKGLKRSFWICQVQDTRLCAKVGCQFDTS